MSESRRIVRILASTAVLAAAVLSACGLTGDLYLSEEAAPPALPEAGTGVTDETASPGQDEDVAQDSDPDVDGDQK